MNLVKTGNGNGNRKNGNKPRNGNKPPNSNAGNGPTLANKVKEVSEKMASNATNLGEKVSQAASDIKQNVSDKISNATEKIKSSSTAQDTSKVVGQIQDFMQANSAISKFVAVVISILVFYMLFNLGIHIMSRFLMPTTDAKVLDGLAPSNKQIVVYADPNVSGSIPILRSINQGQGLEFTWDFWFFVNDVSTITGYGLIFSKGLAQSNIPLLNTALLGVCPGAYINKDGNNHAQLIVAVSTLIDPSLNNTGVEKLTIQDIPLGKWVHCAIRVQNISVDIYVNGVLAQRKNLLTLPQQNYYDTYIGSPNSFDGYVSSLNYYAYALNYDQIQSDYIKGPNMKLIGQNTKINYKDYLAMNWYYRSV
jgi:gas vesicle protein